MSGLSPNSANIDKVNGAVARTVYLVVHPEYEEFKHEWAKIRDAIAGERQIKRKAERYLRPLDGQAEEAYASYLYRAIYYNMASQTLNGMVGQVFRRDPVVRNLPGDSKDESSKLRPLLRRFCKDGTSLLGFCKTVVTEQIGLGRMGALVDAPSARTLTPSPYAVGYTAENILDWTIEDVDGEFKPTRILLREFERGSPRVGSEQNPWIGATAPTPDRKIGTGLSNKNRQARVRTAESGQTVQPVELAGAYTYRTIYRELLLEEQLDGSRIYCQKVYEETLGVPRSAVYPQIRGKTLVDIPFVFFGASSNAPDVEKPPLLDIVDLNLHHYRNYAQLEHGRFYTALPTYYAPGNADNDAAEYHIGPSHVWEVPSGETPGILEYTGRGLDTLSSGLDKIEQQIAAIGGRLMPGMAKGTSMSSTQTNVRESNEQALLLNIIMSLEDGMTDLIRWWLAFRDVPFTESVDMSFEVDTTFLTTAIDARGLRAMQLLYQSGTVPMDVLYEYLSRVEIIPSTMDLADFKKKMDDPDSFIGQPDAVAMRRGYANRSQELEQTRVAREADFQQQELELQERQIALEEEAFGPEAAQADIATAAARVDLENSRVDLAHNKTDLAAKRAMLRRGSPAAGGAPQAGTGGSGVKQVKLPPPAIPQPVLKVGKVQAPGLTPAPARVPKPGK